MQRGGRARAGHLHVPIQLQILDRVRCPSLRRPPAHTPHLDHPPRRDDVYAQDSIDLLTRSGIEFQQHEARKLTPPSHSPTITPPPPPPTLLTGARDRPDALRRAAHVLWDRAVRRRRMDHFPRRVHTLPRGAPPCLVHLSERAPCAGTTSATCSSCSRASRSRRSVSQWCTTRAAGHRLSSSRRTHGERVIL